MEIPKKLNKEKIQNKNNKNEEELIFQLSKNIKEERMKNQVLKDENDQILKDIITVKNNIKSLIPCLPQNRLYPFPPFDEIIAHILNFLNIDSLKLYTRLQNKNNFSTEIILKHFHEIFTKSQNMVISHFSNVDIILNSKFKNSELIKTVNNIINNAYQVNWKVIFYKLASEDRINLIIQELKQNIYDKEKQNNNLIIGYSSSFTNNLKEYIKNSIEVFLKCYISNPKINIDLTKIGKLEKYNSITNEILSKENISKGEECYIIIPSFTYYDINSKKLEIINKDKIILNLEKTTKDNNNHALYKNISKFNINSTKSNNHFSNKYDQFSLNNNKINFRKKKNYENEIYDRKKYSEIYFNSKSYANRNVNYYNFNTNIHSISNNYNKNKIIYNRNYKKNLNENNQITENNKKDKRKFICSDDEDKD